jgi:hypothetical protein
MPEPRHRIELRADPEWYDHVRSRAKRLGLSVSAFLRLAASTYPETKAERSTAVPVKQQPQAASPNGV